MNSHIPRAQRRARSRVEKQATTMLNKLMLEFSELLLKHRFDLDNKEFTDKVDALDRRWRRYGKDLLTDQGLNTFHQRCRNAIADLKKVPEQLVISKADLPALKKAYKKAVDMQAVDFTYKGEKVMVSYAKYLIQYLEGDKK